MGKYFNNEELDALWARLVNATESVTGAAPAYRWVIENIKPPEDMPDYEPTFLIEGNYLTTIGDVYELEGVGGFHFTFPISLSELDTNKTYRILDAHTSQASGYGTGTLVYKYASGLKNTGLTGIHDALINHFGLIHDNDPVTVGDYMKGIAVCSRYNIYRYIELDMEENLETIVDNLEKTFVPGVNLWITDTGNTISFGCF
jgi:hypothetical protein